MSLEAFLQAFAAGPLPQWAVPAAVALLLWFRARREERALGAGRLEALLATQQRLREELLADGEALRGRLIEMERKLAHCHAQHAASQHLIARLTAAVERLSLPPSALVV
ncbi:hypothetical protein [Radicibacter daui]|uniref:hypothetical protein n=1 Tax=Radicibacter daui TaxID=3064829 RepID=UPI004046B0BF